jgi:hypothetical protein
VLFFAITLHFASAQVGRLPVPRIDFSGSSWIIRQTDEPSGPMDNYFGAQDIAIVKNDDGSLTLRIFYKEGIWYAGELTFPKKVGYGTYTLKIATPLKDLDHNLVFGFFTYSEQSAFYNREIDIEASAWGERYAKPKGQFVVQPYEADNHMKQFDIDRIDGPSTISFTRTKTSVDFYCWKGHGPRPSESDPNFVAAWSFTDAKHIPRPSNEAVHINLYLFNGKPPLGKGSTELRIDSFTFTPLR